MHDWIDSNAIGRPQKFDDRFHYNPPRLTAPATSQEQFDYDNQREIEVHLLTNPAVAAHQIQALKDRVDVLETQIRELEDDRDT